MWSGFYKLDHITDINILKELYQDALNVATSVYCDIKDIHYKRIRDEHETPENWIQKYLSLQTHNVIVNRYVYNGYADWAKPIGEIASCTTNLEFDKFLWIYVSLEDLDRLILKYDLKPWAI